MVGHILVTHAAVFRKFINSDTWHAHLYVYLAVKLKCDEKEMRRGRGVGIAVTEWECRAWGRREGIMRATKSEGDLQEAMMERSVYGAGP